MRAERGNRCTHWRSNDNGFIGKAAGVDGGEAVVVVRGSKGRFSDESEVALEGGADSGAGSPPRRRGTAVGRSGGGGHGGEGRSEIGGNLEGKGRGWAESRVLERESEEV